MHTRIAKKELNHVEVKRVEVRMRVSGGSMKVFCMCTETRPIRCALLVTKNEPSGNEIVETVCIENAQVPI